MLVEWNKPCAVTVPRAIKMMLALFFPLNQHMCDMQVKILTFNMMLVTTLQDMVQHVASDQATSCLKRLC